MAMWAARFRDFSGRAGRLLSFAQLTSKTRAAPVLNCGFRVASSGTGKNDCIAFAPCAGTRAVKDKFSALRECVPECSGIMDTMKHQKRMASSSRRKKIRRKELLHFISQRPPYVNWFEKGAVAPIRCQAELGACYGFALAASVESVNFLRTGSLISLSVQQILDCSRKKFRLKQAFEYLKNSNGLCTEEVYPYLGRFSRARKGKLNTGPWVTIDGFCRVPPGEEWELQLAVAEQPVCATIDINASFRKYTGGIFEGLSGTSKVESHAVLVVGYGTAADGRKYWLIKNSWGVEWGERGFMRLLRTEGGGPGVCGITKSAWYPTKD